MNQRDARLRVELIGVVALKLAVLVVLWMTFVHGAGVPVDADTMARRAGAVQALSETGEPNGH